MNYKLLTTARSLALTRQHTEVLTRLLRVSACQRATEGERQITDILKNKLNPTYIDVRDISGGCGSMYQITIDSDSFKGKRMIEQHRMVNEALGQDIVKALHGLTIRIGNDSS